ncbi:hypothetical protein Leryth_027272 [Lithospermum erythrorhizon]|nr:hypothetical protein Leryth_027272 [Lithospermum erythrorhizon]
MKEAIKIIFRTNYDPGFGHIALRLEIRGASVLRRIKEDVFTPSADIDSSIFKEEIGDQFFTQSRKVFSRTTRRRRRYTFLLEAHLSKEWEDPAERCEIPIVERIEIGSIRSIDDQKLRRKKQAFTCFPKTTRAIVVVARPHGTTISRGTRKRPLVSPSSAIPPSYEALEPLCAASSLKTAGEFDGREGCNNNWAMRDFFKYCKRRGLLIKLDGEAILVIRSERGLARKQAPLKTQYLIRICYARYADDLLLGIMGAVELLIEIQKTCRQLPVQS